MDCKLYCMFISAFSVFFLTYLGLLVAVGSETLYIEVHNRLASVAALFISVIIYAVIFGILYYNRYINIDRKEALKAWVIERRAQRKQQVELQEHTRQSQIVSMVRESKM